MFSDSPPESGDISNSPPPLEQHPALLSLRAFGAYYSRVLKKSLQETRALLPHDRRTIFFNLALLALAVVLAIFLYPQGIEEETPKYLIFIVALIFFVAFFLAVNFVRAPYLLDLQRDAMRQQASNDLKAAQVEFETLKNLVERYGRELETANGKRLTLESRADLLERQLAQASIEKSGLQAHLAKLSERLLPKFQILFEDTPPFVEHVGFDPNLHIIRLRVFNDSAKSIESVTVYVETFEAFGSTFKDIPLRIMNDDSRPPRKHFSLHPDTGIFVDLAMKDARGSEWRLLNAYDGHRYTETGEKDVTIRIVVTGLNAVPGKRRFRLYVDSDGMLHCEPLDPIETVTLPIVP